MNLKCRIRACISSALLKIFLPKVTFRVINDSNDLEEMYNLIWQVYGVELNYINSSNTSKEILKDEFENYSIKIGAFLGNNIIGTLRLIPDSPVGFYVEKDFNIELESIPRNQILELSRLVVKQNYRNKLISFGLLREAFLISKKMEKKYWIVVIPEKMANYFFKKFGVKFYLIKEKPLTKIQLEWRKKMNNYYLQNPKPYLVSLEEVY